MYIVFHNYVEFLGMKCLHNNYITFSLETNCIYLLVHMYYFKFHLTVKRQQTIYLIFNLYV